MGLDAIIEDMVAFWDRWSGVVENHTDEALKVWGVLLGVSLLGVGIVGTLFLAGLLLGPLTLVLGLLLLLGAWILVVAALSYGQQVFIPLMVGEDPKGTLANTIVYNLLRSLLWVVIGLLMMAVLVLPLIALRSVAVMMNTSPALLRAMPLIYIMLFILLMAMVFASMFVDGYISGQIYRVIVDGESPWNVMMDSIGDVVFLSHRFMASALSVLGGIATIFLINMVVGVVLFMMQVGMGLISLCIPFFGIFILALVVILLKLLEIHLGTLIYPFMVKRAWDRGI